MNEIELREKIEAQGYEVRNIRVFSKSFHVNYWHPQYKAVRMFFAPLSETSWDMIEHDFPKVEEGS